jgi:hypothetical protein
VIIIFSACNSVRDEEEKIINIEYERIVADELISNFKQNNENVFESYQGKIVEISGTIFSTGRPKDNIPRVDASYIIFGSFEKNNPCIQCCFDEIVVDDLKEGDEIIIRGQFYNVENNTIILRGCKIL